MQPDEIGPFARSLDDIEGVLSRWMDVLRQRSWKLRSLQDGDDTLELLRERCRHFSSTLGEALRTADTLATGSPVFREAVQSLAFTAGWMAGAGLPVTDAVALVHALEEVLGPAPRPRFFQSLLVVVAEAFASSLVQRERARHRDAMEKSQVVCDLHQRLPCLFLVGDPDRQALEDAAGRVMMLAAMREAGVVLVDGSALLVPESVLPVACSILAEHGEAAAVRVVMGGVPPAVAREMSAGGVTLCDSWSEALGTALQCSGLSFTEDTPR